MSIIKRTNCKLILLNAAQKLKLCVQIHGFKRMAISRTEEATQKEVNVYFICLHLWSSRISKTNLIEFKGVVMKAGGRSE